MKNLNQELDRLFQEAKNEKPLISVEEVTKNIESKPATKSIKTRYFAVLSCALLIGFGLLYFNNAHRNQKLSQFQLSQEKIVSHDLPVPLEAVPEPQQKPYDVISHSIDLKREKIKQDSLSPQLSIDGIQYLSLTDKELENIGILIEDRTLNVYTSDEENFFVWHVSDNSNGVTVVEKGDQGYDAFNKLSYTDFRLRHVTVKNNKRVSLNYADSPESDILIPIKIDLKKHDIINKKPANLVVWYEPTTGFLAALPSRYRNDLQRQLAIHQELPEETFVEQTNCGYLETFCRDISIFDRIKVFPNPATTHMTVHFESLENCDLSIDLMSAEGRFVQNLFFGSIHSGAQQIALDINSIDPDLYLLKFETSNGEYETMRVIIM